MKNKINIIILVALIFFTKNATAQDVFNRPDIATVNVDNLSEAEISKIKAQLSSNNMTIEQAEPIAVSKGMKQSEFLKLKSRLASISTNAVSTAISNDATVKQEAITNTVAKQPLANSVFGSELFDNPSLSFEPNLRLATPLNYILGPSDELQISLYGVQEFATSTGISSEGKINVQFVGQIQVAGMTIEAATQKIKAQFSKIYTTLASGQSKLSVTLSKIRTIKVTIIGSKQPGNYSVSSLATVFNALHIAGGPGINGSYRNIELIRGNKLLRKIDIYRFLVNGDQSDNLGLKDDDVIRIPAYDQRVMIEGEVKRPGIFEMKKGEKFTDLLNFASGFNEFAYTASVNVVQKTSKEYKVADIKSENFNTYIPNSGDIFKVSKILNRFENRIKIEGAVFRPNVYAFQEGMTVSELVAKADGLTEDVYSQRARLTRIKPDLTIEVLNIDLSKAMNKDANEDVKLRKEDALMVYSILDFKEDFKVSINGEIKRPGSYNFKEKLTLNDLILEAGGLKDAAAKKVEVARMIKSDNIDDKNPVKTEIVNLDIDNNTNEQLKNFELKPFDVISIRHLPVYETPAEVVISGAVVYPGNYAIANKKEKIFSLISRAGGLLSTANIDGVKIKRPLNASQIKEVATVNTGADTKNKTMEKIRNQDNFLIIPIDWRSIVKDQNDETNVTVFPGDIIEATLFNEGVKVSGNVLLNSEIPFKEGKGFNYYINSVGGMDYKGWKKKSYIIYPNGKAAVTGSFLFFKSYPKVMPGSQIVVPEKPEKTKMTTGEIVSVASVLTALMGLIITILK